jgi:uncharacterized paraquat-inducible protein A
LLPPTLPLSVISSHVFNGPTFYIQFPMACRNLCERLYSKIVFGKSHYEGGKKYCRRCEVYYCHDIVFVCPRCGMALRMSPTNKRDKERLRQSQLRREEEQDRIIRIIKGIKK